MQVLFIHQTRPGQFQHLAPWMVANGHQVTFLSKPTANPIAGVKQVEYRPPAKTGDIHPYLRSTLEAVRHGQVVAGLLGRLKQREGYRPDVVFAHPGWGEALYVKDVWPDAPLLNYCEFFYHAFGSDTYFDPQQAVNPDTVLKIRTRNTLHLLNLDACDWGITPTWWQWRQHPPPWRPRITVLHDGIDMEAARPDPTAILALPDGRQLGPGDEVVTYVARQLEPYRGFPTFMHAAQIVAARRPRCQFVVVGAEAGGGYGPRLPAGRTFREEISKQIAIDPARLHFLGRVPHDAFLKVLQVSTAHVYLTVPFILSWSMLEAMSAGCVVVGSNTPPVAEVIEDGRNGFLADFFAPEEIAERIEEALIHRSRMASIRKCARDTIAERYELSRSIQGQVRLLTELAEGRRPAPTHEPAAPSGLEPATAGGAA